MDAAREACYTSLFERLHAQNERLPTWGDIEEEEDDDEENGELLEQWQEDAEAVAAADGHRNVENTQREGTAEAAAACAEAEISKQAPEQASERAKRLPAGRALRPSDVRIPHPFRPSELSPPERYPLPNGRALNRSTGAIVWPAPLSHASEFTMLHGLATRKEVGKIRALLARAEEEGLQLDTDPDTVDGMLSHEIFVHSPE